MKKNLLLAIGLAACTLIPAVSAKAGKPVSCGSDVTTLSVTIDGVPGTTMGYNVYSDGNGAYASSKKISLGFQVSNCTYDLVMNLSGSSRAINVVFPPSSGWGPTTAWFANFDRIASVPITDGQAVYNRWCNGGVQKNADGSIKLNSDNLRQDNYAPCGSDGAGAFARRNVGFGLAGSYDLRFQNSPIDSGRLANDTALIKVYHPNANTWIIEPDIQAYTFTDYVTPAGFFGDFGELGVLLYSPNSGTTIEEGKFIMPFKMTVTKP